MALNAQITTNFTLFDHRIQGEDKSASIGKVDIYTNCVLVEIKLVPNKEIKRLHYFYSPNTYLLANGTKLPLLGAVSSDGESYHTCYYDDGWGWDNAKANSIYSFTLIFDGTITEGVETCSLIDDGSDYHGFIFRNIKLDNPKYEPQITQESKSNTQRIKATKFEPNKIYIGYTNGTAKLKEGAGSNYKTIITLNPSTPLIIDTSEKRGSYYYVTVLETGEEGYISAQLASPYEEIQSSDGSMFQSTKRNSYVKHDPSIEITNLSHVTMTLTLGKSKFSFKPSETRTITIKEGTYKFKASSPGIIPLIGSKFFESDYDYTWQFFIRRE